MRLHLITLLLPVLTAGCVAAQVPLPDMTEAQIVRITEPGADTPNEVAVAINPVRPANVVAVSMQYAENPRVTNFAYYSFDGGATWTTVRAPNPDGRVQGDDAVAFGPDGTAYHSYISFEGLRVPRPERASNGVFVSRSKDGGRSWSDPVYAVDHLNTVVPFEDKPWLAVDRMPESPHRGNIYVAWSRFDEYGSTDPADSTQIVFSLSQDGGATFAPPFVVSDTGGNTLDDDDTVEGAVPSVGLDGEVYLVWAGPRGLVFDRSLDGGWTWGEDIVIADNPGGWDIDIDGINRHNGMPVTGVDLSEGRYRGTLYVCWIDERHGDPDVFVAYSRDRGDTWSDPVRVNDDPVGNDKEQFFAWMAIDPVDGAVNIIFYDRRSYEGTHTALTLARSTDGGQTFVNHDVGQAPFETTERVFFGDYIGIDAFGGRVIAAYTHFIGPLELAISAALFDF